jgi:hypothetical protein
MVLVWVLAAAAANLPFLTERIALIGPKRHPKPLAWRLLELFVLAAVTLAVGTALETSLGQRHDQGWPFYAVFACAFLVLAFPGFVWRYLRRSGD